MGPLAFPIEQLSTAVQETQGPPQGHDLPQDLGLNTLNNDIPQNNDENVESDGASTASSGTGQLASAEVGDPGTAITYDMPQNNDGNVESDETPTASSGAGQLASAEVGAPGTAITYGLQCMACGNSGDDLMRCPTGCMDLCRECYNEHRLCVTCGSPLR